MASEDMVKNAVGNDGYDELAEPPHMDAPDHHLWPVVKAAIKEIYDPEIPVNIYELGLIYKVDFVKDGDREGDSSDDSAAGEQGDHIVYDVDIKMTLTSPGCPVAQEMPGWLKDAVFPLDGIGDVDVEIVWDPVWDPSFMAETAKMQLNMFS